MAGCLGEVEAGRATAGVSPGNAGLPCGKGLKNCGGTLRERDDAPECPCGSADRKGGEELSSSHMSHYPLIRSNARVEAEQEVCKDNGGRFRSVNGTRSCESGK